MSIPRKLTDKLDKIHEQVKAELMASTSLPPKSALGENLSTLAIKAILGGRNSDEWKDYMTLIAGPDSPKQFERLTFRDDLHEDPYVIKSNVYIVANAVCGTETRTHTINGIETPERLNQDLPEEP